MSSTCRCPAPAGREPHGVIRSRTLSVDLFFTKTTTGFMEIFVDCLARLPNLRTLEVFSVNRTDLITKELGRERAQFSSIRELWVNGVSVLFVRSCPNVESVMITGSDPHDIRTLCLYGCGLERLKRVAGVPQKCVWQGELEATSGQRHLLTEGTAMKVVQAWPDLQEICIRDQTESIRIPVSSPCQGLPGLICLSFLCRLILGSSNT